MKLTAKRRELIAAVQEYAKANYDVSGWSVIVECYDEQEIAEVIGRARTLKGALAKFATIVGVVGERIAATAIEREAAIGATAVDPGAAHYVVRSTSLYPFDGLVDCSCGAEFFSEKAADLHVAEANKALGCYDATAEGYHPDGSIVRWRFDEHSGEGWASRTWPGKVGRGSIEIEQDETGDYVTVERYVPGWRGADLASPSYCDYDPAVPF